MRAPAPALLLQVSKKLLLLYVQDQGGGSGDRSTPHCLARMAVHERLVRRWVPESHRPPAMAGGGDSGAGNSNSGKR